MTEKNDNWFGSWLTAAKNKSSEVLEFVKKDLEEFGNAVKNEANSVMTTTGSVIEKTLNLDSSESRASSMKKSFSTFLGQVNTVLNPAPDDSDTEAILIVAGSDTVKLTKLQEAIYKLQIDENTFLKDPAPELDNQYQCYLEIIDDQYSEESLVKHLTKSTFLNDQYVKLVPEKIPHNLFWRRYLFKKALLEDELARQEVVEKRKLKEKEISEEAVKWEQEDFADDIELTEEEQIRILEQYEHETKQRKQKEEPTNSNVSDEVVEEQIVSKKPTAAASKPLSKSRSAEKRPDEIAKVEKGIIESTETCNVERKDSDAKINKVDSSASLETASSSSSDGDWEKISTMEK